FAADVAPSLTASGRGVERIGETRGQDPVIARCMTTGTGQRYDPETETILPVAFVQNTRDEVRFMGGDGQIVGALAAETGAKQQCYIAQFVSIRGRDGGATAELGDDLAGCLRASSGGGDKPYVLTSTVRRLTPRECERLQGFPDDYTLIPWRGKPAELCPDGPRYKALGNSMAVPVMRWIGERIEQVHEIASKEAAA